MKPHVAIHMICINNVVVACHVSLSEDVALLLSTGQEHASLGQAHTDHVFT